jgi:acyl-CoA synthetase (AMP-forming)/AMP-acid ligase II
MLRRAVSSYGDRDAVFGQDGSHLTYRQLDRASDAVCAGLIGSGLEPGDRVIWLARNCTGYLIAYYATAKAGLAICPLNYWLRPGEMEQLLGLLSPRCLIAGPEYVELLDSVAAAIDVKLRVALEPSPGWTAWRDLATRGGPSHAVPEDEGRLHEIIFTSGTTGQAKGVMRSQRKRILDSAMAALAFELTRNDHMVSFGPQFHIGGFSVPNQVLIQGGAASILQFDPEAAAAAIGRGVTYIVGVPAHYNLMFEAGVLDAIDTGRVKGCYVGGSVATAQLFDAIRAHFPNADLVHGYGSTESGPHTMALRGQDFLDHYGSLGLPVPGNEVRVVDAEGRDVPRDAVGELLVRSETVMDGYFGQPDLTKTALTDDGWLHTGDLVRQDASGYFYLAGRAKDLIISGGENVYPKEVEDVIAGHTSVAEVAVIGVPDPVYEERVVALVRRKAGQVPVTELEIISFVRERLAGFKAPKEVQFVEEFPRTPIGKIAREELKKSSGSVFGD